FPSAAVKKELVGAGNTLYAKPWTREVFVQAERFPAGRLRHELAHVFAASFGDPLFGVSFAWHFWGPVPVPRLASGLIEGVAEAAERARAQERFRRPAIFSKVCARELAARVAEARGRMYAAPQQAVALLETACHDDPDEPSFRLDLADALVAAGRSGQALSLAA